VYQKLDGSLTGTLTVYDYAYSVLSSLNWWLTALFTLVSR